VYTQLHCLLTSERDVATQCIHNYTVY